MVTLNTTHFHIKTCELSSVILNLDQNIYILFIYKYDITWKSDSNTLSTVVYDQYSLKKIKYQWNASLSILTHFISLGTLNSLSCSPDIFTDCFDCKNVILKWHFYTVFVLKTLNGG